ncbi:DNA helicase-2 / ATP-dependent DNA helicase PcrA [Anaerobranca californiensis DSM 14826]|jgi:DNA helicase-2/ATP-dependent DNA helicase PcrA|uniref:ATP-dependent DNA helicase n=1 Tax=Anaerobranca californiensis DSM 14826 TaxID=1120989 RepID=A0A1M6PYB4_9FIRM|nr:DNA helicase PcrA [Anaerobranca californiensis]SHK12846.1 DNA helicase-2 / ATP-dependent DNA helicase PcrA [Anaerobranca californiensis DSM 14826]
MNLLNLNPQQREAVQCTEGPLLIIAGAGSGKTRVLTHRIAYILSQGLAKPWEILAITFTNKAAAEMLDRVENMVFGGKEMWISTFHSACVRILRREAAYIGFDSNFNIYDTSDQLKLLKDCLKELNIDDKKFPPRNFIGAISKAKNQLVTLNDYSPKDYFETLVAKVYKLYQRKLKNNNAMDFDDLIMETVRLFKENPDILQRYQQRFKYILVDEYQDTNHSQYVLINLLAGYHRNLCVVGDDDQSIYLFRGADVTNILDFEKDYPEAKVVKLEQNYRSTGNILAAANDVIKKNSSRKSKRLWTDKPKGDKIVFYQAENSEAEGRFIAEEIENYVKKGRSYGDMAVLYRTNAMSRVLEDSLLKKGIPYIIYGATEFYQRKEIKDILAYLKILVNPHDNLSIVRVINVPKRGIGDSTVEKLLNFAEENDLSLYQVLQSHSGKIAPRSKEKIREFVELIETLKRMAEYLTITELLDEVVNRSGYGTMLKLENTDEARSRLENIQELATVTQEFDNNKEGGLAEFIQEISLNTDIQRTDGEKDVVKLLTLHSAKGLEFPIVFIAGMEERIFPHIRSYEEPREMEEERRLCYVGITRAMEKLYLTCAQYRSLYGRTDRNPVSRFIEDINPELIENRSPGDFNVRELYTKTISNNNIYAKPVKQNLGIPYQVGMMVEHKKFGQGIIIGIQPLGDDQALTINFEQGGIKKLMASFAPLKVVES